MACKPANAGPDWRTAQRQAATTAVLLADPAASNIQGNLICTTRPYWRCGAMVHSCLQVSKSCAQPRMKKQA